jgi:hypothetical protein
MISQWGRWRATSRARSLGHRRSQGEVACGDDTHPVPAGRHVNLDVVVRAEPRGADDDRLRRARSRAGHEPSTASCEV